MGFWLRMEEIRRDSQEEEIYEDVESRSGHTGSQEEQQQVVFVWMICLLAVGRYVYVCICVLDMSSLHVMLTGADPLQVMFTSMNDKRRKKRGREDCPERSVCMCVF